MLERKRNYGIDLLRIVSMWMIVGLHVLGDGGGTESSIGTANSVAWLLECICICGVDCFAIISGYVGYTDKEKKRPYRKILSFWLQVFFYSFGITLIFFLLTPETVGIGTLIKSAMPIATKQYWYVSAYFALVFAAPFVNKLIRMLDKRECTGMVLIIFVLLSLYGTFSSRFNDPFQLNTGYSFIWLMMLYIVGSWLKKYQIPNLAKKRVFGIIILCCMAFTWLWKVIMPDALDPYWFINYISPTVFAASTAIVSMFSKFHFHNWFQKIVSFLSPAAFGVYLIHVHRLVLGRLISGSFTWAANRSALVIVAYIAISTLAILLICLFIEKIRLTLFKAFRIDDGVSRLSDYFYKKIMDVGDRFVSGKSPY